MSLFDPIKYGIKHNPRFFRQYYRRKEMPLRTARVVRPHDDAVIEGFPRSANTFATHAFLMAQGFSVKLGNHFHNPAQFLLARDYGVPAMLVIRDPKAACLSYMIFMDDDDAAKSLRRYIAFHKPLIDIADSFSVAPFDEVTSNFGKSIDRLNDRFGTNFAGFEHQEESQQAVFDIIAKQRDIRAKAYGSTYRNPLNSTTPNLEKRNLQKDWASRFDTKECVPLLQEAQELHRKLTVEAPSAARAER